MKSKSRILVTGADGFIGSHLVERLVSKGYRVRALVLYNSLNHWGWLDILDSKIKKKFEVFAADIRDSRRMREAVEGCEGVLHLAALIAIPYSYHAPESYVDTNIRGTLNLLEAARAVGIKKFVQVSTSEVYGSAQTIPITENHPLNAQSPYAATKIAADQLALSFHKSFGLSVAVARPFNTFGPRQSLRAVIPTIITQLAAGQKILRLGALTPTRDFTYVSDTAAGLEAIYASPKTIGEVVQTGSEFEVSIGDTAALIAKNMGVKVKIVEEKQRLRPKNSEVERLHASTRKIRSLTQWKPEFNGRNGFEKGLKQTIHWFTQKKNLEHYKTGQWNL